MLVQFAKAAIDGEQLGKDDVPDVLFGVVLAASTASTTSTGRTPGRCRTRWCASTSRLATCSPAAEKAAGGRANLLVVLTADHGGAAIPEEWAAAGLPGVRVNPATLQQGLAKELQAKFNAPDLVAGIEESTSTSRARR